MHNLPFDTIDIDSGDMQALEDIYNALNNRFDISVPIGNINVMIDQFDLFTRNPNKTIGGILSLKHPVSPCYLIFVKVLYIYHASKSGPRGQYYKYKVFGCITSKKDYGRILIRRETLTDRIINLLHPIELNFEDDKLFNHKFFVCTNDEQKAHLSMNWNFRNAIMGIKSEDMVIEAVKNTLIMGNNHDLFADEVVELAEVLLKVASNC